MSLRFIYGGAGSGKSHYCLQDIKRNIEKGNESPLILLVPEQFSFQAEKNLIDALGESGMLRAEVLSFRRMAYRVFNEVGGLSHKHINAAGRSMLIHKIMDENISKLKVFRKAAKKPGFITTISDIITEFKRYNVTGEELNSLLNRVENENLKNKLEDITLIFSEFQENLHKKYIDAEDDLTLLSEKLSLSSMFNEAEIWVDEFSSFSPQEYVVLEKLMLKAKRVNITLCTDSLNNGNLVDNTDLFLPTKNTEEKLLQIIKENNIRYDKPIALNCEPCYRFKDSIELQHLQKYLFKFPHKEFKGKIKDIQIYKALNRYSEVEDTARDIVRICRDKGFRFKDIAVVSGDLDGYESLIGAVFSEYNIPYFIDKKRDIGSNPIIVLILSAIEIISKNWSYESVFRYLKTGLLDLGKEDIDILENYILANGIRGNTWLSEENWSFRLSYENKEDEISQHEKETLDKINETRDKLKKPLINFSKTIKGRKTGREMCEGLYEFMCSIGLQEKVEVWINFFKENDELDKANEYNQIWDIVIEVLDQVVETIGDEILNRDTFSQILSTGFNEYKIGIIPPALDQVLVGSITRLRSHDITALYILGVNDGIFPASMPQEGVLTDIDRQTLKDKGVEIAKDTKSRAFEEQFLIYTTLTIVSKYLRVSYPVSDEEGKTKRPSIIIPRLKKLFPGIIEQSNLIQNLEDNIEDVSLPKATFNELISNIRKNSEGKYITPLWLDVYRWYRNNDAWKSKMASIINGFYYTNNAEIMDTSRVRKLYGRNLSLSVSRLEKYVECPFSYFIQYGLKAKERKVYKFTSPDLGSFMHNMLQNFSEHLKEKNLSWSEISKEWCENEVGEVVKEALDKTPTSILNSSKRYGYFTEGIKRVLTRSVWLISEHIKRGKFAPTGYELSFSNGGNFPPISVNLHSGETVSLIGRVDRVDTMNENESTYLRIIDYKSGIKEFKLSDVYYGLQMQLLIYMDAMLSELEEKIDKEAIPAAILYFRLHDPIVKTKGEISEEEIEKRIVKSLKMNGLLLNDPNVIKDMDIDLEKNSDIIPASIKKDGSLSESLSSVATVEQFNMLRKYVKDTIAVLCERMLEGNIEVSPCKKKSYTSCNYCIYSAICQFDTIIKENKYRNIKDKKDEEVWQEIEKSIKK